MSEPPSHLEGAHREVADAEQRVAEQRALILMLVRRRQDRTQAIAKLAELEQALAIARARLTMEGTAAGETRSETPT